MPVGAWFATDADVPADVPASSVQVTSGHDPAIAVVDQVSRGTDVVGRITADAGAVMLRLPPSGPAVRVVVELRLDDAATRWWADRVRPARSQAERPRLILIRSQGRTRHAVVLARRQGWLRAGDSSATVAFDLTPGEIADGLVLVELAGAGVVLPGWAAARLSVSAPTGVLLVRVTAEPATGASPPDVVRAHSALLVAPAGQDRLDLVRYRVPPAPPPPRAPGNRWTRQRPSRAVLKILRAVRRATGLALALLTLPERPTFRAVDLSTGADVPLVVRRAGRTRLDVRYAAPTAGPVLLGLVGRGGPGGPGGPRRERTGRQPAWGPAGSRP